MSTTSIAGRLIATAGGGTVAVGFVGTALGGAGSSGGVVATGGCGSIAVETPALDDGAEDPDVDPQAATTTSAATIEVSSRSETGPAGRDRNAGRGEARTATT